MPAEQDTLSRMTAGPAWSAQALVPPVPMLSVYCPKIARIAPDEVLKFEAAFKRWEEDFVFRLTRGANQT